MEKDTVAVVICSGDEALRERLRRCLARWASCECVRLRFAETEGGEAAEEAGALVFLDMGTAAPARCRDALAPAGVVITRNEKQAIEAYRLHPAALLPPDFSYAELRDALSACAQAWAPGLRCLELPGRRGALRLPMGSIRYIEAQRDYCLIHSDGATVRVRATMLSLERLLPGPPFLRCHKSYIIHLQTVRAMRYTAVQLGCADAALPVGRRYSACVRRALELWKEGEIL